MIFSVHIPKTAGTSFRHALEARFPGKVALYYGLNDPKTTPAIRVRHEEIASRLPALEAEGFEILHGHVALKFIAPFVRDPAHQVWTWLRDPVERTLSQYSFYKDRPAEKSLAEAVRAGEVGLDEFAEKPFIRELQTRYLRGFALEDLAFVGLTEQFELGLALLFGEEAPQLKRRYNATDEKIEATEEERAAIAALNPEDEALYAEAKRLFEARVAAAGELAAPETPRAAGSGLLKRLIRRVA